MAFNYSTLWEAFAGGKGWRAAGPETGEGVEGFTATDVISPISTGQDTEYYQQRMTEFYDRFIGPAFGYDWDPETPEIEGGFGTRYPDLAGGGAFGGLDLNEFERAEMEFRLAIGDPYGADDPFSWENISRYGVGQGPLSEAQKLLEGELFDEGHLLGGEYGSDYNLSLEQQEKAYSTGILGQKGVVEYADAAGLVSGTSGTVLRTGETISHAEDLLMEAYKKSKSLGGDYIEGRRSTEKELRDDLTAALDTYVTTVENEKEKWYGNILADIMRISTLGATTTGDTTETAFGQWTDPDFETWGDVCSNPEIDNKEECEAAGETWEEDVLWQGLEYEEDACSDPNIDNKYECEYAGEVWTDVEYAAFREGGCSNPDINNQEACEEAGEAWVDEACATGELYVCDDNGENCECTPYGTLDKNVYGELIGTGEGLDAIYGCMTEGACNYNAEAHIDDGSCIYEDCLGVCGGNNHEDECGVCGGTGPIDALHDCKGDCIPGEDCHGDCGGTAVEDECGECDGTGIPEGNCDCFGNKLDECGVCAGPGIPSTACDCDGSEEDECGVCNGGGPQYTCPDNTFACTPEECADELEKDCWSNADCTGQCRHCNTDSGICEDIPGCGQDCFGNWNGTAELDECNVCGGDNSTCTDECGVLNGDDDCVDECGKPWGDGPEEGYDCWGSCIAGEDCAGKCGGLAVEDECGVCGGDGPEKNYDCNGVCLIEVDCNNTCGGDAVVDVCGVCGGDGLDCADCAGTPWGNAELDECGVCDGDGPEHHHDCFGNCIVHTDCAGICGGTTVVDERGVCGGEGYGEGECGSDDDCGECERCDAGGCLQYPFGYGPSGCPGVDEDDGEDECHLCTMRDGACINPYTDSSCAAACCETDLDEGCYSLYGYVFCEGDDDFDATMPEWCSVNMGNEYIWDSSAQECREEDACEDCNNHFTTADDGTSSFTCLTSTGEYCPSGCCSSFPNPFN